MIHVNVFEAWKDAERRVSKHSRAQVEPLRRFLRRCPNPHARVLSGYPTELAPDQTSIEDLQALIIRQCESSRERLSQWLAICRAVIDEFATRGCCLPANELAPYLPASTSPFAPLVDTPLDSKSDAPSPNAVERWRDSLNQWIRKKSEAAPRHEYQAAILLSAILNGALVDNTKIKRLLGYLSEDQPPTITAGIGSYSFNLPYQGLGDYHLQRWILDPITELLIWRQSREGNGLQECEIFDSIETLVLNRLSKKDRPRSIHDIIKAARTWWSMRTAQIDIQATSRQFYTHAFHPRTWTRLFDGESPHSTFHQHIQEDLSESEELSLSDEIRLLYPWLALTEEFFGEKDKSEAIRGCEQLVSRFGGQTPASIYLQWLHTLLLGESSSGNPLGLSTIAERYPVTVSHLLGILGETNPASMSIDELEDIYSDLTSDNNPTTPIRHLTQGLRDFHRFLQKHYKIAPIRRESEILGNDASLKPVDANLISFDDYIKIQHWLDSEVSGHDWGPCKLVCMLAFQCGMRRMEIFGLRLEDIQLHGIPHIVIQPHSQRGLKTKNSQRIIPARVFLSPAEINFLRTWIAQRKIECFGKESSGSDYLFAEFGNPKKLTWVNRIYRKIRDAIRAVTGDELLYLHHLRHAFATWNYLRLRAPDHPMILRYFDPPQDLEHTCAFLKNGKRARILLMGASRGPRRAYAFAIAKLLGHASPAISLGHYIHASDLLLGAAVWRESRTTPKPVLIAASIRGKSVIYDHLDNLALPEYISSMVRILNTQRGALSPSSDNASKKTQPSAPSSRSPGAIDDNDSYLSFKTAAQIYNLAVVDKLPNEIIAKRLQLSVSRIQTTLSIASEWESALGLKNRKGQLVDALYLPRTPDEKSYFEYMETRLRKLSTEDPDLLDQGLSLHLKHYYPAKKDVVFRSEADAEALQAYLCFVKKLGLPSARFEWHLRYEHNSIMPPDWSRQIIRSLGSVSFKNIGPQTRSRPKSYCNWIGLLYLNDKKIGAGKIMGTAIFLAKIARKTC